MATRSKEEQLKRPPANIRVLYDHELQNAPGKSVVGLEIEYPPDGFTPPHRHGGATVVATIIEGQVLSGVNDNPPKVYAPGESFMEGPGCHHTVSENASDSVSTKFIAVFVVDTEVVKAGYENLTVIDKEWT